MFQLIHKETGQSLYRAVLVIYSKSRLLAFEPDGTWHRYEPDRIRQGGGTILSPGAAAIVAEEIFAEGSPEKAVFRALTEDDPDPSEPPPRVSRNEAGSWPEDTPHGHGD